MSLRCKLGWHAEKIDPTDPKVFITTRRFFGPSYCHYCKRYNKLLIIPIDKRLFKDLSRYIREVK